jgi:hypothetical protein
MTWSQTAMLSISTHTPPHAFPEPTLRCARYRPRIGLKMFFYFSWPGVTGSVTRVWYDVEKNASNPE